MKTLLLFGLLCGLSLSLFGQSTQYKPFKVDLGLLVAFPLNDDLKIGGGGYIEPKYNIDDQFAGGLRIESVIIANNVLAEINGDMIDFNVSGITSFLLTGDYYFTTSPIRPFAGLGAGIFICGEVDYVNDVVSSYLLGTRFGIAPRIGVLAGHFRLGLEYNMIPGLPTVHSRDYLSLKIGFEIGGGKL